MNTAELHHTSSSPAASTVDARSVVSLLTGGADQPYAFGLTTALLDKGAHIDLVAGNELDTPELREKLGLRLLNLRGDQRQGVSTIEKAIRVLRYYVRLLLYAATAPTPVFHILWNNKVETFDRTGLMLYYRLLGKKIVLTVHNVNAGIRDGNDSWLNRLTLRIQYLLAHHVFVHTARMKQELVTDFGLRDVDITEIPFGINNAVPHTRLSSAAAREQLGLSSDSKVVLFFGTIAPYKGLEFLVSSMITLLERDPSYRLVIAGRPRKGSEDYWESIDATINRSFHFSSVVRRIEFVPDEETEVYFKAADVAVLPYLHIFQSGVLFLSYSFGLPVVAADVGDLKDDIIEGETGFVVPPRDPAALTEAIATYFTSDLFAMLSTRRREIRDYAAARHSWDIVADRTLQTYRRLLASDIP